MTDFASILSSIPASHRDAVAQALDAARAAGAAAAAPAARMVVDPRHVWPTCVWETADALFVATARKQSPDVFGDVGIAGSWRDAIAGMRWSGSSDAANGRPYGYWRIRSNARESIIAGLIGAGYQVVVVADYAAACAAMRQHEASAPTVPAAPRSGGRGRGRTSPVPVAVATAAPATVPSLTLAELAAQATPTPPQG